MSQFRESVDVQLRANRRSLQTISAFAQAVGLSASALRQYGENGLLIPTEIEERTGYRYYSPDQQQRAIWIRRLRDAGLSLERIRTVLEGDAAGAATVLDGWLADAQERSASAEELVTDLKFSLQARIDSNPTRRTSAQFDAMVLASAIESRLTLKNQFISGTANGASVSLELSEQALADVAHAAVGHELICDIGETSDAIAWRSPDQPDFVALVMPRQ